jgi:23S rRNA (cytidine1920-2'-O)/16S rRNA (cytidine1409-2'-O)-methyltransferase
MVKQRLDFIIAEKGLAESRNQAQRLIMAGQVRVNGQVAQKPADMYPEDVLIEIDHGPRYVSRGGEKLDAALEAFGLTPIDGWVCADVGASTGGFTDCLLQHGAARVYAIDVGYGVLHWKLRQDQRVISMERTNARFVTSLPEKIQLVSIDASFISLQIILPVVHSWLEEKNGLVVALIKPQFEAGKAEAARGDGVIRDPQIHKRVLNEILGFAQRHGFSVQGLIQSPLFGPKGNTEFLTLLSTQSPILKSENDWTDGLLGDLDTNETNAA